MHISPESNSSPQVAAPAGNEGSHSDPTPLSPPDEDRRAAVPDGNESHYPGPIPPSPPNEDHIVIAVMGASGAGKSTFINLVSGSKLGVGYGLASKTKEVDIATFWYRGHNIVLVDTPGFDDTEISDTDTLRTIANWLEFTYQKDKLLSGIIYLHRITDNRVGGISAKNIRLFHKLCGKDAMRNVILCTTMWDLLQDVNLGIDRENELASDFWKAMIDEGAMIARHDGTIESARRNIIDLSSLQRVTLSLQKSLAEGKNLLDTDAGKEISRELLALQAKYQRELEETKREMEDAIRENDAKNQQAIREERAQLEEKLVNERKERDKLSASREEEMAQLRKHMEDVIRENDLKNQEAIKTERAQLEKKLENERKEREKLLVSPEEEMAKLQKLKEDLIQENDLKTQQAIKAERERLEGKLANEKQEREKLSAERQKEIGNLQLALEEANRRANDRSSGCRIL